MSDVLDALASGGKAALGFQAIFYCLLAIGLNMHFGYTGLLNFGQVGFALVGSYGVAVSVAQWEWSFWVGVVVAVAAAVVLALLLGIPTLRLRADYLAIATIATAEGLRLFFKSGTATPVTNGTQSLSGFSADFMAASPWETSRTFEILGARWSGGDLWVATVGWGLVALFTLLTFMLVRSPWGRVVRAVREDEDAVRALGKNVYAYKMQSLVLGGVIGAFGGIINSLGTGSTNPDNYQNAYTFLAYAVLILGGAARVLGPVIGSIILLFIVSFTDAILRPMIENGIIPSGLLDTPDVARLRFVLVGLLLMALLVFRPQGIFGDRREVMLDAR